MKASTPTNKKTPPKKGIKKTGRKSKSLVKQPLDRVKMEIGNLTKAVENALDPVNSDRTDLLTMYENSWKDSQVIAEREKAESYLITEPFEVLEGETMDKKKTKLFERPWFTHFITIAMYTDFWEYTLAEFQEQDEKGEFTDVKVFPRKHVRPFERQIVINPTDREGISYEGNEYDFFLLPLGDPDNPGKLESITREVIWKTVARSDWSEYNERFGKPLLDFAIDTNNEEEVREKTEMAANFGSNGWMVRDIEEEVNIVQIASRASAENFKDMALFCDDQIAKLMNGQTGTSDEKSFVGSAEVHERVLDKFTEARLKRVQDIVNYKLLPFLQYHGYPITDKTSFCFSALKRKAEGSSDTPKQSGKPESPEETDEKKNDNRLPAWLMSMQDH